MPKRSLELAAAGLEIHAHQPWRHVGEKSHNRNQANEVGERVGGGRVVRESLAGRSLEGQAGCGVRRGTQ